MTEKDIIQLIKKDQWMMEILQTAQQLHLPDWCIGAGFVRSKVWDTLHNYETRTPLPDIDLIYFDKTDFTEKELKQETTKAEARYENYLKKQKPEIRWSVTNQARMHRFHNHSPYKTSTEALSYWVETATCIGVRLNDTDQIMLTSPHGIEDLVNLVLRPTPGVYNDTKKFYERVEKKNWLTKWPRLRVIT